MKLHRKLRLWGVCAAILAIGLTGLCVLFSELHLWPQFETPGSYASLEVLHPTAHTNLGTVLQCQERQAEALESFQKAVQRNPNDWQAHYNLANAYLALGQRGEGIYELRKTLCLNPAYTPAKRALALLLGESGFADP